IRQSRKSTRASPCLTYAFARRIATNCEPAALLRGTMMCGAFFQTPDAAKRGSCSSQVERSDRMTSLKHSALAPSGQTNDDDFQWDDSGLGWVSGSHQGDCDGHEDHHAIHKDLNLQVAPTATSGDFDMHAVLDSPAPTEGRTLMILVSGSTYD